MAELRLFLNEDPSPELLRLEYQTDQLAQPHAMVRGRSELAHTFIFSPGLRAFTALAIRACHAQLTDWSLRSPSLTGGPGSLAAHFDWAVTRKTQWTTDLLGTDSDGCPILPTVVWRQNPGGNQGRPVRIAFVESFLSETRIRLFQGEREIISPRKLAQLWQLLLTKQDSFEAAANDTSSDFEASRRGLQQRSAQLIADELRTVIQSRTAFTPNERHQLAKHLSAIHQEMYPSHTFEPEFMDAGLIASERAGLDRDAFHNLTSSSLASPLVIACSGTSIGALAVLSRLRSLNLIPLELEYRFTHGLEILQIMLEPNERIHYDGFVVTAAQLIELYAVQPNIPYRPCAFLPPVHFRVLRSSKMSECTTPNKLYLLNNRASSSHGIYRHLVEAGRLDDTQLTTIYADGDELAAVFRLEPTDTWAISWFPWTEFNRRTNQVEYLEDLPHELLHRPTLLLLHDKYSSQPDLRPSLPALIQCAWRELAEDPLCVDQVSRELTELPDFSTLLERWCGLHNVARR